MTDRYETEPWQDGVRVISCVPAGAVLEIPSVLAGKPVRALGARMLSLEEAEPEEIRVPSSVRQIESEALAGSGRLQRIVLSEGLVSLAADFAGFAGDIEVGLPASVAEITEPWSLSARIVTGGDHPFFRTDDYALYRKSGQGLRMLGVFPQDLRKTYAVPAGTVSIEAHALEQQECLEHLSLPASLKRIQEGALISHAHPWENRRGITEIEIASGCRAFRMEQGCLLQQDGTSCELMAWTGSDTFLRIPEGITAIGEGAFRSSGILRVELPASLQRIGAGAFTGTQLEEIGWKDGQMLRFPGRLHPGLEERLLECIGHEGRIIDGEAYDRILQQPWLSAVRTALYAARLSHPLELSSQREEGYRRILSGKLIEAVQLAGGAGDAATILALAETGLITRENCGACLETLMKLQDHRPLQALMAYQQEHFGALEEDLEL